MAKFDFICPAGALLLQSTDDRSHLRNRQYNLEYSSSKYPSTAFAALATAGEKKEFADH